MTTSHWLRSHRFTTPDIACDLVIVGSGYVGLSVAYWVSEFRPDLKIVIIDRSHLGAGASGRNAGFLTKGSATFYKTLTQKWGVPKAQEIYQYAAESLSLVHQHILQSSPEIKFEKTTSLTLFQNESEAKLGEFNPRDFDFEWKSTDELNSSLQRNFFGAYENGSEYKVDPIQLLQSLKSKLEARKIQFIENLSAFEIHADGVSTEVNRIKAKQVVLALNGYFPQFHPCFKDLIKPKRAQMLAVELEDDIHSTSLHYDSPQRVYWRKSFDKTLLIGGMRLLDEQGEVGDFDKISGKIQTGLESYLQQTLKVNYKVLHRWSGIMGFTEHELPIISRVEAPTETIVIGGFSGHGMGLGFRSALDVAKLLTGQLSESFFDQFKSVKIKL